jgi:hypothetical protein
VGLGSRVPPINETLVLASHLLTMRPFTDGHPGRVASTHVSRARSCADGEGREVVGTHVSDARHGAPGSHPSAKARTDEATERWGWD